MINLTIVGNLGADAEVRTFDNGRSVINFSLAHTEKWTDAQGVKQEKTTWFRCAYWVNSTAISQYLSKGTRVAVYSDTIDARAYTSQQTAEPQASLEVQVRRIELLGGGQPQQQQPAQQQQAQPSQPQPQNQTSTYGSTTGQSNAFGASDEADLPF